MTYKGAIKQLYEMRDNIWMPEFFKPYFDKIIETMPNDVRENVKGEWRTAHVAMGERPKILYCSVCNQCIAYPTNYCPNCGADMRGEA